MAIFPTRFAIAAVIGLSFISAATTWAQVRGDRPVTGLSTVWSHKGEAKVTAIDQGARKITLTTPDGRSGTYTVGQVVRNLDRIKVGDTVNALYQERTTYVLSEAGAKVPGARETVVAAGAPKGQNPSGVVTRDEVANYIVISTDVQANTMTLVPVGGGPVFDRDVVDPTARATLPRVKPGNYLTVIEREILVAEVSAKP
jgi:hypothetical protein